jgi:group II intron reverse transcriptase/maturase
MTTQQQRAPKKSKLRHAEYYDFQEIQDRLYAQSQKGREFKCLVDLIALPENIRLAYRNIKNNNGSRTAGTDGRTIEDLARLPEQTLIGIVQRKLQWYVPQQVRRVEIPKDPGKTRLLGIPTIMDRLIQQCVLQVLEPICEAKFHEHSFGFRPNRSQEHAVSLAYRNMQISNLHYVVDIDIKGFFDNVNHGKLLKQMWTLGMRDKKLLSIISAMLKAEVAGIGFPEKGTPQGGIISPLLSNIVLNELDWWLASQWVDFPTKHAYKPEANKYDAMRRRRLKECRALRYADDFKIFTNSYSNAVKLYYATIDWLKHRLGLDISLEKSKIVNLRREHSEFLGFKMRVTLRGKRSTGAPKFVVKSHISDKAKARIRENTKRMIRNIEFANHSRNDEYKALCRYNAYVLGVHNYYRIATRITRDCSRLACPVQRSLKTRLKDRLKTAKEVQKRNISYDIPQFIRERYGGSKQMRFVGESYLVPLGYVQHSIPMMKKGITNSYTAKGRAEIHKALECVDITILHYLMRNPIQDRSVEYNDNRLSLYSAQQGKCYITSQKMEIGDIHCHHKTPIKSGGNDRYQNLVLVTEQTHRLIHATASEVIQRYLKILRLNAKQLKKLNQLRELAGVETV